MSRTEGTVPWPDELALQYARAGWWRGRDLGAEFADVAAARPDATALVDGTTRISYGSLQARADALASRLARLGLRRGMRIVVQLPNGWPFVSQPLMFRFRLSAPPLVPPQKAGFTALYGVVWLLTKV